MEQTNHPFSTKLIILAFYLLSPFTAQAQSSDDLLDMAMRLIKDGHFSRAELIIDRLAKDDNINTSPEFLTTLGLHSLYTRDFQGAIATFEPLLKLENYDRQLHIFLAQSYFGMKNYKSAVEHFTKSGELKNTVPSAWLIAIRSQTELGANAETWRLIVDSLKLFPEDEPIFFEKIKFLKEHSLNNKAYDLVVSKIGKFELSIEQYLKILQLFAKSPLATKLVEAGRPLFKKNEQYQIQAAFIYFVKGQYHSSAMFFEEASKLNGKFSLETAEAYLKSKDYYKALFHNQAVKDEGKKYQQRLAIFLQQGRFEEAARLSPYLKRHKSDQKDQIKYGMAYAFYRSGRLLEARNALSTIKGEKMFEKSLELISQISQCSKDRWKCT